VGTRDKTRDGLFLFNYLVADDANVALELWDYLAGWFEAGPAWTTPSFSSRWGMKRRII